MLVNNIKTKKIGKTGKNQYVPLSARHCSTRLLMISIFAVSATKVAATAMITALAGGRKGVFRRNGSNTFQLRAQQQ
jgi:hypothetical protein